MTQTTEGTGNGSATRVLPKILNGIVKTNNFPDLNKLKNNLEKTTAEFHVAKHGSDSNSGSVKYPFLTIQKAVDYAEENVDPSMGYIVKIHPGRYAESVVLTRAKAHLCASHSQSSMTMFCSVKSITVNCVEDMGGQSNTQYAIDGILVAPNTGNCITISGDKDCTVIIKNCNLYADNAGQKCLVNTNEANIKTRIFGVVFNNKLSNEKSIDISAGWLDLQHCYIYNGAADALNFSGETLTVDSVVMQGAGDNVLTASGSGQLNISNSLLETSAANSNGFNLSGTVTCTCIQNVFRIPSGTGYAANGVAGVVFVHALNVFLPTYNNKLRSLMTNVAASTTPTLA